MKKSQEIHQGNHFQKYLKNAPWYLFSSLTTKAMGFLLLPMFTHYLSPEEFGTLSTLEALGRVLPIFLSLYLDAAFSRYYYQDKKISEDKVSVLFSTHFWFLLPWGVIISVIVIIFSPYLMSDLLGVSILPIIAVVFTQLLNQLAIMVTMIWTANLLAKRLAIFQIIMSLLSLGLTVYFMVYKGEGWESRLYALGFVAVLQFCVLLFIALHKSWLSFSFDFTILKRSLKFSVPLIPNIAAGWIAMFSDRIILAHFGRLDEVGLYSIAAQIAILMYVINDAITKVQGSIAMSGLVSDKEEAKKKMSDFLIAYFTLMSLAYFSLTLFSRELLFYFTEASFHDAYLIIPILAFVYVLSGFYRVFTIIISFHNATWIISAAAFLQALTNIAVNISLIPTFGMFAAAFSTLISMMFYTLFIIYFAQRLDKIFIQYSDFIKIGGGLLVFIAIIHWLNYSLPVGTALFLYKLILLLFFCGLIMSFQSSQIYRKNLFRFIRVYFKKTKANI